jgi:hypothetical protein
MLQRETTEETGDIIEEIQEKNFQLKKSTSCQIERTWKGTTLERGIPQFCSVLF